MQWGSQRLKLEKESMEVAILIGLCVLAHGADRFYSDTDKNVYSKIRKVESDQDRLEVTVMV